MAPLGSIEIPREVADRDGLDLSEIRLSMSETLNATAAAHAVALGCAHVSGFREVMTCACGARQTTVFYAPQYQGLGFGCARGEFCRSQDEGDYPTEAEAERAISWYAGRYRLTRRAAKRARGTI